MHALTCFAVFGKRQANTVSLYALSRSLGRFHDAALDIENRSSPSPPMTTYVQANDVKSDTWLVYVKVVFR